MATENNVIKVETTVNAPIEKVWSLWNAPEHIIKWNSASDDWHTTKAENELVEGGKFLFRMEVKDGSMGFDFGGVYNEVKPNESIKYTLGDGRMVSILFTPYEEATKIVELFEAETTNSLEHQQMGWQAILDNFKEYAEINTLK